MALCVNSLATYIICCVAGFPNYFVDHVISLFHFCTYLIISVLNFEILHNKSNENKTGSPCTLLVLSILRKKKYFPSDRELCIVQLLYYYHRVR
jgi:hypothetical protein